MENQDEYAKLMEKAIKDALAVTDNLQKDLHAERDKLIKAQEALEERKKKARQEGAQWAAEVLARRKEEWKKEAGEDAFNALIVKHLKAGKTVGDIAAWLDLPVDMVQYQQGTLMLKDIMSKKPRLEYHQDGRGGTVTFFAEGIRIPLDWEFGGGDTVAIVFVPKVQLWEAYTGTSLAERMAILEFVGKQVVHDQAAGGFYMIGDDHILVMRDDDWR